LRLAGGISNQWSYAAFVIAAILFLVTKNQERKTKPIIWIGICALALVVALQLLASAYLERIRILDVNRTIYRVRTLVLSPTGTPLEDAKV